MVSADPTPIDKRALVLRWIEEQEALCAAIPGDSWGTFSAYAELYRAIGRSYPRALAAMRAETAAHQPRPSGYAESVSVPLCCPACSVGLGDGEPCPTIDRLFCSLGLQDSGR